MPIESEADRAIFLDPEDFGALATYQPAAGSTASIAGLVDKPASRAFPDPGVASSSPRFTCRAADLPAAAKRGDTLTVAGTDYLVQVIDRDGTGMATLTLEEAD